MADDSAARCPVCGGDSWRIALRGSDFRIDMCTAGCVGRTVPPPVYSPDLLSDACVENLTQRDQAESGHFAFANRILDLLSRFQSSGKLLDIGSGRGHLLMSAADRGYDAIGLEAAPGVESIVGSFPQHSFAPKSFDVVALNHVMEHLDDPRSALAEIERILKPGGLLAICVPDFSSLMRRVKSIGWQGLQPSQHVWQLSSRSVSMLAKSAGLETLIVQHSNLDYRRGNGSLLKWLALRSMLTLAGLLKLGDNAIVIVRKPLGTS